MRSKKGFLKRIFIGALSVCMLTAALATPQASVGALSTSEMKSRIADYEQREREIEARIDSMQDDVSEAEDLVDALNEKISNLEDQISLVNDQIYELDSKIKAAEKQIAQKQADIQEAKDTLKQRLRAIYIAGTANELQVLLSAEDYADYLAKAELMRGVTDHDTALMDKLNSEIKQINELKAGIVADKADSDSLKQTLVKKQNELDDDYDSAQSAYDRLISTQNELENEKKEVADAKVAMQAEWEKAIREAAVAQPNLILSDYNFAWPFQNSYYISCPYGQSSYRFHTGVDITCSGAMGKPIYAIADGSVTRATYSNYSYGNCIIINHGQIDGDNYSSLYAHCSSLLVSQGESVKKGQLIAYCGSTGNSTGPHLHFEIRVNGSHTSPLRYYRNY